MALNVFTIHDLPDFEGDFWIRYDYHLIGARIINRPEKLENFWIELWGYMFFIVFELEGQEMTLNVFGIHDLPDFDGDFWIRYDYHLIPFSDWVPPPELVEPERKPDRCRGQSFLPVLIPGF